jgi:iron-sulfur cluster assembly protein
MIELTEAAAEAVHTAIAAVPKQIAGLRLIAVPGDCSGPHYEMGLIESIKADDLAYESRGVQIFIEPASLDLITGTTIDYISGPEASGFKFNNPHTQKKSSCGKSCC